MKLSLCIRVMITQTRHRRVCHSPPDGHLREGLILRMELSTSILRTLGCRLGPCSRSENYSNAHGWKEHSKGLLVHLHHIDEPALAYLNIGAGSRLFRQDDCKSCD